MSILEELEQRYLKDLNEGYVAKRKTKEGNWVEVTYLFSDLLQFYCVGVIPKMVFLSRYKKLPPIEGLQEVERKKLVDFVNEIFPDQLPEFKLDAMKIIFSIGYE